MGKMQSILIGLIVALATLSITTTVVRGAQAVGDEIAAQGILKAERMTNFPDNPWAEMVLETESGEQYVLIGEEVGPLHQNKGAQANVKGVIKPPMSVRGTPTPVIEVHEVSLMSGS